MRKLHGPILILVLEFVMVDSAQKRISFGFFRLITQVAFNRAGLDWEDLPQ
jgi:hypothetical protein